MPQRFFTRSVLSTRGVAIVVGIVSLGVVIATFVEESPVVDKRILDNPRLLAAVRREIAVSEKVYRNRYCSSAALCTLPELSAVIAECDLVRIALRRPRWRTIFQVDPTPTMVFEVVAVRRLDGESMNVSGQSPSSEWYPNLLVWGEAKLRNDDDSAAIVTAIEKVIHRTHRSPPNLEALRPRQEGPKSWTTRFSGTGAKPETFELRTDDNGKVISSQTVAAKGELN
ncbi:MAG: hypothetical protein V4719_11590 [Planctomycetota bacterium]